MNFVFALFMEAKPFIAELGLKKYSIPSPFSLYQNDNHQLIISGIGKKNAANAVSFLHGRRTSKNSPWLNIGLAGHGDAPLGKAFQIARFTDEQDGYTGYPPQVFKTPLPKTSLLTCNQPTSDYQKETAYDMEASAFFETANQFSTSELVQSVKIISDNPDKPVSHFDKSQVQSLMTPNIALILKLSQEMNEVSGEMEEPTDVENIFSEILSLHPLSETQTYQLKKAIRHARILDISTTKILKLAQSTPNSKSLISSLNKQLETRSLFS